MQPHNIKSITEFGAVESSVVNEEYWTKPAKFEAFAMSEMFLQTNKITVILLKLKFFLVNF